MEAPWRYSGVRGGQRGAPQRSPEEEVSRAFPKSLGSQSSSVDSKLPAAKPTVFIRIQVLCQPRVRLPLPKILSSLPHQAGSSPQGWKQEERARGSLPAPLSPGPQRLEFLGWADGPPPPPSPKPEWVGRGKPPHRSRLPFRSPRL